MVLLWRLRADAADISTDGDEYVPTALQRAGDFSQTFATNGQQIVIYDPNPLVTLPDGTKQRTPLRWQQNPDRELQ